MKQAPAPWPTWLLALIAVGPPATALVPLLPTVTRHPVLAGSIVVAYWIMLGLAVVLRKAWERRGDAWTDAGVGRVELFLLVLFSQARRRYRRYFCYEHSDLDMKGISTRGTYTLDLEQVFVEVRLDPTPAGKASHDPLRLPSPLQGGRHAIWDYLVHLDQHLVILGAPGSGKTTLLKHLGLRVAQKRRRQQGKGTRRRWKVPIFLPLREQHALLKEHPEANLVEAANHQIQKWQQPIPPQWLERQLRRGRCLVLLDGLDEVADPVQRQQVVEWVERQMLAYGSNRFVIASRPLGYQHHQLDHVSVLDVQPFTFEQITRFLHAWYRANEIKRAVRDDPGVQMRAREGAEDLLKRLHSTPVLFAMAVNPLLLTMIATVHLYYGKLPGARITLYKAICEVFLSRRADLSNSTQELRAEQRQLVLQVLAYDLMQQGQRDISREDACRVLAEPLQLVSQTLTAPAFLEHLEAICSGLFLEREAGMYCFAHHTFQEYLAMMYIQEHHQEGELLLHVEDSWWHETILLYGAQADATAILDACLAHAVPSLEALVLAIDCVEEARTVKPASKERLYSVLEQGIEDTAPERRTIIAQALLKRRLRQMRPLHEGAFVDTSLLRCAEYQVFVDEQRLQGVYVAPDIWKGETFSQGDGKRPVLGVCFKEAQKLCKWLTEQDREGWSYRLPKKEERQQIEDVVRARWQADTSYWEERGNLVWVGHGPSRSLQKQALSGLDLDSALDSTLDSALDSALDSTLDSALVRASTLVGDLVRASTLVGDLVRASTLVGDLVRASAISSVHDFASASASALALVRDLTRDLAFALTCILDSASAPKNSINDFTIGLTTALEIYLLLFFFVQRPQHMHPPHEGILLIKERIPEASSYSQPERQYENESGGKYGRHDAPHEKHEGMDETSPRLCSHIPYLIVGLKSAFSGGSIGLLSSKAKGLTQFLAQSLLKVYVKELLARFRMDSYTDKISKKMNEEIEGEKIRRLIEIVLESHLSKEDQSNLIKEIIARKVLVSIPDIKQHNKKYEGMDNYADKISKKMNEDFNSEKIRKLIEIVLESHLSKEDQNNLIKEIIAFAVTGEWEGRERM